MSDNIENTKSDENTDNADNANKKYIIAFSGKKGSGKNVCSKFIHSLAFTSLGLTDNAYISESGELMVNSTDGLRGFDLDRKDKGFVQWMEDHVWPTIKQYAFADVMKETAINIFGLSYESVYGSDADKMEPTHILWENFPLSAWEDPDGNIYVGHKQNKEDRKKVGPMSGRQFLQFVGTELFRKMCPGVFVNASRLRLEEDGASISTITDLRFVDEFEMIKSFGSNQLYNPSGSVNTQIKYINKVIRLTRNPHHDTSASHESEHALDPDKFDWGKFDYILDNENLTQAETLEKLYEKLVEWGVVREKTDE